ncbi:MAG: hydroxyacylglutathione hydrolase [Candidatus Tokpelaia sp. JSC189]|nr:MAG: hydroxyacylglutathione hydrolase [Candidatus Tokpelaia sp. JSC189]
MLIEQFLCRTDNFAVLLHNEADGITIAIDAPSGASIATKLNEMKWNLNFLLITHHHVDHTEGIPLLKKETGIIQIIGPEAEKSKIQGLQHTVNDTDIFQIGTCKFEVIATPGHTTGAISYYIPEEKLVFTGDTLFSLGCGRLFEDTSASMFSSLQKLSKLPDNTKIYCGHEYTESNGQFALTIDPNNQALQNRMKDVVTLRSQGKMTLPSTIALEHATNPFLRCTDIAIRKNLGMSHASDEKVFSELRRRKDNF